MNCQIFEDHINELARGALTEAALRESAAAHTETCARCASRLADERSLAGGLSALAAGAGSAEAPARVEAALLAAFRARAEAGAQAPKPAAPSNTPGVVIEPVIRQWSLRRTFTTAAMAAAAAVVLLALLPAASRLTRTMQTPPERAAAPDAGAAAGVPSAAFPGGAESFGPEEEVAPPIKIRAARVANDAQMTRAKYSPAGGRAARGRQPRAAAAEVSEGPGRGEVVTDFIPLMSGGQFAPEDAGQVVRVELPRAALASMGLPVSAERAGERVRADVLMGEDGTARAIRFVR